MIWKTYVSISRSITLVAACVVWLGDSAGFCGKAEAASASVKASVSPAANESQAVEILRQMEQRYGQVRSVAGQFQQLREDKTPDMGGKIESQAQFWLVKPNKFRADYAKPRESTTLITDQYSYRYLPELKQVERYKFQNRATSRDLNYLLLGFGAPTDSILQVYSVQMMSKGVAKGYKGIQLIPLEPSPGFKYITILLTANDLVPTQFTMVQSDAVKTTVTLDPASLQFGASVDDKIFRPNFPYKPIDIN